jgi:hypothetical protein
MSKSQLQHLKHNVHEIAGKEVVRVQADIDRKVYDSFFRHTVAYTHGARQAFVTFFFQRLYEECLERKIPEVWDEDSGDKVLKVLNELNFNGPTDKSTRP